MIENNVGRLKTFAQTEREKIREQFVRRAGQAPIVSPLDPESLRIWDEYVLEMRELELQLQVAGDLL